VSPSGNDPPEDHSRDEHTRDGYIFEWNLAKAHANLRKHGVDFPEATTAFGDPMALIMFDPDHSTTEDRWILLGRSSRGRILVVSFVERHPRTRIISARFATRLERIQYASIE
jgi:uncharacterized DUF497 family protein